MIAKYAKIRMQNRICRICTPFVLMLQLLPSLISLANGRTLRLSGVARGMLKLLLTVPGHD
jgi:hypothetical protein